MKLKTVLILWLVTVVTIVIIVGMCTGAKAAPFLACDPAPNVTGYILEINGVEVNVTHTEHSTGAHVLMDLKNEPVGSTYRARAIGPTGRSGWSVPFIEASLPAPALFLLP